MSKAKEYLATTFIGGLVVMLPLVIFFILIKWLIGLISGLIDPITSLLPVNWDKIFVQVLAFAILIVICFIMGLMVRTQFGKNFFNYVEEVFLSRLPLYTTIKETVQQFFGDSKTAFKQVVLVDPFKSGAKMIGFVTDVTDEKLYTIFVPTAPNPTNGYVFIVNKTEIEFIDAKSESAMKAILGLGYGMNKVIPSSQPPQDLTQRNDS